MKTAEFTEWFYEDQGQFDPNNLVNKVDAEFKSFHDWIESALEKSFNAGFERGSDLNRNTLIVEMFEILNRVTENEDGQHVFAAKIVSSIDEDNDRLAQILDAISYSMEP